MEAYNASNVRCFIYLGYWWTEISYPYDTVSDGEEIVKELTEAMIGIWDYIKNGNGDIGGADPTNWALVWFGNHHTTLH